ncbi:UNVERIFIED_CONTAM: hypothetical protein FKN15_022438 [Acipenser sinensis]
MNCISVTLRQYYASPQDSSEGSEVLSLTEEVAKWWGEWSSWSTCSRTCGGGVQSQERHCLKQRSQTMVENGSFKPQVLDGNGSDSAQRQTGFRLLQCSPLQEVCFCFLMISLSLSLTHCSDDYINISNKPCDLQCTTSNGERQLLVPAHDGTSCRDRAFQGVCIEGNCEVVGCDGMLYSSKTTDKCGVCGGDGRSCYRISGSYRKGITQLDDYINISNKPCDLQCTTSNGERQLLVPAHDGTSCRDRAFQGVCIEGNCEVVGCDGMLYSSKTTDKCGVCGGDGRSCYRISGSYRKGITQLALSDEAGHFFFNGNTVIDNPRNFRVAGTVFKYRRPSNFFTDGFEYIIAQGPTNQGLNVMYYNLNGKMPHITYEYTVPSSPVLRTAPPVMEMELYVSVPEPGITTSYAMCVRYDGVEVDESYCDAVTRPEPTHEFCSGKECLPRWETSRWSECSRTCGEGYQFRTVRCWKMMAPGFDSSVYDDLCEAAELQRPMERKMCRNKGCGPQWEISEWSECSARCGGKGVVRREVRCSTEGHLCNESSKPLSERECDGPPCDRRWTVSDWGPCSGPCGEGRMMRYVVCKNSNGNVISDSQCDLELKPLAVYPCGDKNCPAHWVEQEWEQCNATCGRGAKTRQVICVGLENGVYKEYPEQSCSLSQRPEEETVCFERPCSKWFTTSWSQCSKTCGSGVKVREVRCYQGEEVGHSCDPGTKPESRQTCEIQLCPTEAPDEVCKDKATANCALVLKVKLCTHWYYRKACCQSCKNKTQ